MTDLTDLHRFKPMLGPAEEFSVGSVAWIERMSNRLQIGTRTLSRSTAHSISKNLKAIWRSRAWEKWPKDRPYGTPEDYCRAVTGYSWNWLVATVAELTCDESFNRENMLAENARAQRKSRPHGGDRKSEEYQEIKTADGRLDLGGQGSNNAQRLLRRLARDHPKILARYEAGDFKSVRAAAKAADIIKDDPPLERARKFLNKVLPEITTADRHKLITQIRQFRVKRTVRGETT